MQYTIIFLTPTPHTHSSTHPCHFCVRLPFPASLLQSPPTSPASPQQRVERQTLARQCPTLMMLLKNFPKKLSLQEPTFKDLVVVYR